MGRAALAALLTLLLVAPPAPAQTAGDIEVRVGGQFRCRARAIDLDTALFAASNPCAGRGAVARLSPGAALTTCKGGTPAEWCATIDITSSLLTAAVATFTNLGIGVTPGTNLEAAVSGDAAITGSLKIGGNVLASSPYELDVVGDVIASLSLLTPTLYGGTAAGSSVTLDATSNTAAINDAAAVVAAVNPLRVFPSGVASTLTSLFGVSVGTSGQTNTVAGTTPFVGAYWMQGTWQIDTAPNSVMAAGLHMEATIKGDRDDAGTAYGSVRGVNFVPNIQSAAVASQTGWNAIGLLYQPAFAALTGPGSAVMTRLAAVNVQAITLGTGWGATQFAVTYLANQTGIGSGGVTRLILGEMDEQTDADVATIASLWIKEPDAVLAHEGPAIFGADQATFTGAASGAIVELAATNKGLLHNRVAFASLPTCTSGMQVYCSDCNATCSAGSSGGRQCFCEGSTWVPRGPLVTTATTAACALSATQNTVRHVVGVAAATIGSRPATITANVSETDGGAASETFAWRLYDNGSSACPTTCATTTPSGAELDAWTGDRFTVDPNLGTAPGVQATFTWSDSSTTAGTTNYCLVAVNTTNGNTHTADNVRVTVVEAQ